MIYITNHLFFILLPFFLVLLYFFFFFYELFNVFIPDEPNNCFSYFLFYFLLFDPFPDITTYIAMNTKDITAIPNPIVTKLDF